MIKSFAYILIFSILSQAFAEEIVITPDILRSLVESRNDRVKAKDLEKQSAKISQGAFGRSFLPSIELYGSEESFKEGSQATKSQPAYGAEVKINLFNGGQDRLSESKHELTFKRKSYEKEFTLAEQISEAHTVYWDILYLRDYLALQKEAKEMNAQNLKSANRRIQSGVATEIDRIEFEMKGIELKQIEDSVSLKLKTQIEHLKLLLGYEENVSLAFPGKLHHDHDWQGFTEHDEKDHEFLVKPYEIISEELKIESRKLKRNYWPKIDAFAAWNQYNQREKDFLDSQDRKESVVGLRLTMSLFDGLNSSREGDSLLAQSEAAQLEANFRKREIHNHLHSEITELKLLHNQVHDAEENIKRSEKYYRLTQSEYTRGIKNSPDVLSASEKLFNMKIILADIIRQFQVSKSHLMAKFGK